MPTLLMILCLGGACRPDAEPAQGSRESRDGSPSGTGSPPESRASDAAVPEPHANGDPSAAEPNRATARASNESVAGLRETLFSATIVRPPEVVRRGRADETAIAVGVDPRWSIRLRIEAIEKGSAPFAVGEERTFLIHSPAKSFLGDEPRAGARYHLRLAASGEESAPHFVLLTAMP